MSRGDLEKKDKIRGANPWSSTFLAKFLIEANNQALQARHVHVLIFEHFFCLLLVFHTSFWFILRKMYYLSM